MRWPLVGCPGLSVRGLKKSFKNPGKIEEFLNYKKKFFYLIWYQGILTERNNTNSIFLGASGSEEGPVIADCTEVNFLYNFGFLPNQLIASDVIALQEVLSAKDESRPGSEVHAFHICVVFLGNKNWFTLDKKNYWSIHVL